MLSYLTHKLRTQSLNESETYNGKTDDDRDSGTESDDEGADIEELQKYMESIIRLDGPGSKPGRRKGNNEVISGEIDTNHSQQQKRRSLQSRSSSTKGDDPESPLPEPALDSALPSDSDHNFDHHSSEEELEVINSAPRVIRHYDQRTAVHPEKRKWSQANHHYHHSSGECSGSSDDEVRDLMYAVSAPVEFRTSPPANVHKPGKCLSPPPKVFHSSSAANIPPHELCSVSSPRKRHRRTPTTAVVLGGGTHIQRPCLDFEKMQQINRVRLL